MECEVTDLHSQGKEKMDIALRRAGNNGEKFYKSHKTENAIVS